MGVQWSPRRWRARRPGGARQNLNSPRKGTVVQAITAGDRAAGAAGLTLSDIPGPHAAENDVIVRVHAAGFTPRGSWTGRAHGPTAPAATEPRACPDTSCRVL